MRATGEVRPIKTRTYDRELHCDVVRVVGYEAVCTCGWTSSRKPSVANARALMREHRAECAGVREVALSATRRAEA